MIFNFEDANMYLVRCFQDTTRTWFQDQTILQGKDQRCAAVCGSQQDSAEYYSRPLAKGWKCGAPSRELNELSEVPHSLHPKQVKLKNYNTRFWSSVHMTGFIYFKSGQELDERKSG